jgi:hypothetical protein
LEQTFRLEVCSSTRRTSRSPSSTVSARPSTAAAKPPNLLPARAESCLQLNVRPDQLLPRDLGAAGVNHDYDRTLAQQSQIARQPGPSAPRRCGRLGNSHGPPSFSPRSCAHLGRSAPVQNDGVRATAALANGLASSTSRRPPPRLSLRPHRLPRPILPPTMHRALRHAIRGHRRQHRWPPM